MLKAVPVATCKWLLALCCFNKFEFELMCVLRKVLSRLFHAESGKKTNDDKDVATCQVLLGSRQRKMSIWRWRAWWAGMCVCVCVCVCVITKPAYMHDQRACRIVDGVEPKQLYASVIGRVYIGWWCEARIVDMLERGLSVVGRPPNGSCSSVCCSQTRCLEYSTSFVTQTTHTSSISSTATNTHTVLSGTI